MSTIIEFYIPETDRSNASKSLEKYFNKKIALNIENGLYEYTKQYCYDSNDVSIFRAIYKDRTRDLIYNCEQDNPTIMDIKKQIIKGTYNEYNLAFLSPDELNRENWEKIIRRKCLSEEKINNLPKVTWKPCRDCKCTQYRFYQLQTRSADEPMTTFYICGECHRTYKVNV